MSIECHECERDLRGGHTPWCSRYRQPCAACITEHCDEECCCVCHRGTNETFASRSEEKRIRAMTSESPQPKPQRFQKIPVDIWAIQLTWANWNAVCEFVPKPWFIRGVWVKDGKALPVGQTNFGAKGETGLGLWMQTLESQRFLAVGGDWIIKGVNGEFYPCKPDIFAKTYRPIP